jgi:hypothetical protein
MKGKLKLKRNRWRVKSAFPRIAHVEFSRKKFVVRSWVARFFLAQNTKTGKKYTKSPRTIPNVHKI